jgi:hypothetical protein
MYLGLHVKYLLLLADFIKLEFLARFSKNLQISYFMKIHAVGAELIHADGWTDRQADMTNSRFAQFCDNTKCSVLACCIYTLQISSPRCIKIHCLHEVQYI